MTSKISFSKLMKEDFKRRSWLFAIISLILFVTQPVALLIQIDGLMASVSEGSASFRDVQNFYQNFMGSGGQAVLLVLIMIFAIICAMSGYSYLHSKVKLDFYHSLAIKRKKLFFVQYVSGLLIFALPLLFSTVICVAIGGLNGLLTGAGMIILLKAMLYRILCFLLIYGIAILAVMLTGKTIVSILGTGVFLLYGSIIVLTIVGMAATFFSTYMETRNLQVLVYYFSPAILCGYIDGLTNYGDNFSLRICVGIVIMVLETAAATGISVWLHGIRKSEAADKAIAFPKIEGIIKVLLVIPLSLMVGLYLSMMMSNNRTIWFFGGIVVGVIVLSAVIEFIYHVNMREIFAHKLQIVIVGAVTLLIACVFRFDWIGYDSYIPRKEDIKQMAVYNSYLNGAMVYRVTQEGIATSYDQITALNATLTENIDPLYELAQEGVEFADKATEGERMSISVEYLMDSGKKVYRNYYISLETARRTMETVLSDEAYREKLFPILSKSADQVRSFALDNIRGSEYLDMTQEERDKLLEIYTQELRNAEGTELTGEVVATLSVDYAVADGIIYGESGYPVCSSFKETLAFLKEVLGYEVTKNVNVSEVEAILVYSEEQGNYDPDDPRNRFDKTEDIQEILSKMKVTNYNGWSFESMSSGVQERAPYTIEILMKNQNSIYGNCNFDVNDIPACVGERNYN
ncbi:MAG: DUF6449 domain-containing protein [Lachnospiraceae bacterium]|jgi:ABC-2 type transport system permease protein|nr:DUF6449 domain-containing protein [Lachnospiraceae bacterium]